MSIVKQPKEIKRSVTYLRERDVQNINVLKAIDKAAKK